MSFRVGAVILLALAAAGCGYIGAPLPPALNIPVQVADLTAAETGDSIRVRFRMPAETTEGLPLTGLTTAELAIGPFRAPFNAAAWEESADHIEIPVPLAGPNDPGLVTYDVPVSKWTGQEITLNVRTTGPTGRKSDWTTFQVLTVAPPLAQPGSVRAENVDNGVRLTWQGDAPRYRILRREGEADLSSVAESDQPEYLDPQIDYGVTYQYAIVGLGPNNQESDPSPSAVITPADVFAPATPSRLTITASAQSVELTWARNTEDDFAEYHVFRSVDQGPFAPVATVAIPTYRDPQVAAGQNYRYAITSVDRSGNESQRSEVVDVTPR